jgi:phosphoglycerate kinase
MISSISSNSSYFHKKRIFVRADLNVPIKNGVIQDDTRLQAILPTLTFLLNAGGSIVLASHIGKPKSNDQSLSTKNLTNWFSAHGIKTTFEPCLQTAIDKSHTINGVLLLENLRFFEGEKTADLTFAKQLAQLADVYVNDAFGTIHRTDTSIALLPQQFDHSNRFMGLLIEKEIATLSKLKQSPNQPFMLILGGSKLIDKVPLITAFIQSPKAQRPQTILIGGALSLVFLKASGACTGTTTIEPETIAHAQSIIALAKENHVNLQLPIDMAIVNKLGDPATISNSKTIPQTATCVDIGPKTITSFSTSLIHAQAIFTNGTMGIFEYPEYRSGTCSILRAIANSNAYSVIGGGDSASAATQCKLSDKFNFISTGGGATLAFLGAQDPLQELPALKSLNNSSM